MPHSSMPPERDPLWPIGQLDPSAAGLDMQAVVEHGLQEILLVCAEACATVPPPKAARSGTSAPAKFWPAVS